MEKAERDAILRQDVVLPETPRQKRELAALAEDLESITLKGKPLPVRARAFRPSAEAYLVATRGPLPYMLRLREIEHAMAALETSLDEAWQGLRAECAGNPQRFRREWTARAHALRLDELNDLIDRHNRWYPAESRLPMDPRTGDYALVNGRDYRLRPIDAHWVLERYPPELSSVSVSVP
jgi:hypothetical protein